MFKKISYHPFFIRLFNWEYWPFHIVYTPLYLYWMILCIRARSFFFFNTANPTITNGGFLMESKWSIYQLIPDRYYPSTLLFKTGSSPAMVTAQVARSRFSYPLIAKPDIGMQGIAVVKVNNEQELNSYLSGSKVDFLLQEFISYKQEAGIFYYRYPGSESGYISGIVEKEFLSVQGDGISTIQQLLKKHKRYVLQLPALLKIYGTKLDEVMNEGEEFDVPFGNHVRGAKFIDASDRIDAQLTKAIDSVCRQIDGFYYGRLDIRFNSWEDLRQGKNFSIIELNGAGSEPTHIYDPKHSIFFAWKEIIRHLNILLKISRMNFDAKKNPYMDTRSGLTMLRENSAYVKLVKQYQ